MKVSGDESEDAFSGVTVPVGVEGSSKTKDKVVENSRNQFATPKDEVEGYMEGLFAQEAKKPSSKKNGDSKPGTSTSSTDTKSSKTKLRGI